MCVIFLLTYFIIRYEYFQATQTLGPDGRAYFRNFLIDATNYFVPDSTDLPIVCVCQKLCSRLNLIRKYFLFISRCYDLSRMPSEVGAAVVIVEIIKIVVRLC